MYVLKSDWISLKNKITFNTTIFMGSNIATIQLANHHSPSYTCVVWMRKLVNSTCVLFTYPLLYELGMGNNERKMNEHSSWYWC